MVNATDPTGEQCEGNPNRQGLFAACGGGGGGGLGMLLITALTVAASYMVYRNAVCVDDEALDLGFGLASKLLLPPKIRLFNDEVLLPHVRGEEVSTSLQLEEPDISSRPSGPRITWETNYQAARDASGACIACGIAAVVNPKFCNVNTKTGEGCSGAHMHVFRFHQDKNCYCHIRADDPYIVCLHNPYAGPPGGPHFPGLTAIPTVNPELARCTGGWAQT